MKKQPKQELQELQEQIEELDNKWKRALADYQNLEKRTQTERAQFVKLANVTLISRLLPVIDGLERAQEHLKDTGLEMITKQFRQVLTEEGVTILDPLHSTYDPTTMEAVDKKPDGEPNKVVAVTQKGYLINNMVIRPAKVIVGATA